MNFLKKSVQSVLILMVVCLLSVGNELSGANTVTTSASAGSTATLIAEGVVETVDITGIAEVDDHWTLTVSFGSDGEGTATIEGYAVVILDNGDQIGGEFSATAPVAYDFDTDTLTLTNIALILEGGVPFTVFNGHGEITASEWSLDGVFTPPLVDSQQFSGTVEGSATKFKLSNILPVPYFTQGETDWCFYNSMAMVLQYYGVTTHSWDMTEYLASKTKFCGSHSFFQLASLYDCAKYLPSYIEKINQQEHTNLDQRKISLSSTSQLDFDKHIRLYVDSGTPVIFLVGRMHQHSFIVVGYSIENGRRYVYVHDPSGKYFSGRIFAKEPWTWFINIIHNRIGDIPGISYIDLWYIKGNPDPLESVIWLEDDDVYHEISGEKESSNYLDRGLKYKNPLHWYRDGSADSDVLIVNPWLSNPYNVEITKMVKIQIKNLDTGFQKFYYDDVKILKRNLTRAYVSIPLEDRLVGRLELRILTDCDEIGPIELEVVIVVKRDPNGDGKIDIKDAKLSAEFALGIEVPAVWQQAVADIAHPFGVIDVRDVVRIAEVALGIRSGFESEGAGQVAPAQGRVSRAAKLSIEGSELTSTGTVRISAASAISGIQVGPQGSLSFDPHIIKIKEIRGVPPFQVLASEIDNEVGRAKFMAIALGEPKSGEIIELEVEAVGHEGESTVIKLTPDMVLDAEGNELRAEAAEGRLTLGKAMPLRVDRILSIPNPVNQGNVRFVAEGQGIKDIRVQIYDLSGREVFTSGWVAGNALEWDLVSSRGYHVANGVYLYAVTVRGFGENELAKSRVKKLIVLR